MLRDCRRKVGKRIRDVGQRQKERQRILRRVELHVGLLHDVQHAGGHLPADFIAARELGLKALRQLLFMHAAGGRAVEHALDLCNRQRIFERINRQHL